MIELQQIELENEPSTLVPALERAEADRAYVTKLAIVVGGLIGWVIGVAQLVVIGSWDFFYWPYMPLIVLYTAFGWALFGMIIGESGLFSRPRSVGQRGESARHAA
jgi:hypothetical protein